MCAGILDNPSPNCLAFSRSLVGVDNYDDHMSAKFFDVVTQDEKKTFDVDKKMRLESLKTATEEKVSFDKCYNAEWMRSGLTPTESKTNTDYLSNFCQDFKEKMKTKILSLSEETSDQTQQAFYDEVLHHARFSVTRKDRFLGQQTVIEKVKYYILDKETCMKPLVLHGPSGCGKTSVMSVLVDKVKDWLGGDTVTMIRFLGTSPSSSDIRSTLLSFINQLCQVFRLTIPQKKDIESQTKLNKYFWKLLNDINCDSRPKDTLDQQEPASSYQKNTDDLHEPIFRQSKTNLVLCFDSLDQVKFSEVAAMFQWLPSELPRNVYIITSIASNVNTTQFNDMRKRFLNDDQYIEMKPLGEEDMALILTNNLARQHRKVDQGQMNVLVDAARQCGWPLYLTLLSNEASKWKSYDVIDPFSIQPTVHAAINKIFHDLEVKYNALFVRMCLGYITVSEGISEVELENLLSLNDDVLDSVYEFHNPPLEGVIRVPPLLWARLRFELEEFLVEKDVDGATVLSWYHRQFWETAEQRYLRPPIQHTTDKTEDLSLYHKYNQHLADLFMVETPVKRTIHLTRRNYCIEDADRLVTLQPLTAANRRKLIKLPQFLMRSGTLDSMVKLKELILCNPRWLMTKMQGVSYQAVLDDFTLTDFNDPEILFVHSLLKLASTVLEKNPSLLPLEIISRLPRVTQSHPAIQALVTISHRLFEEKKGTRLFPLFPCLPVPDGHLIFTLNGPTNLVGMITNTDTAVIWGPDCGLQVWNISTHRVIHQLGEPQSVYDIQISADGREVYHTEGIMLVGWSTDSGNMILSLDILSEEIPSETKLLTTMAVSLDGNYVAVRINDKNKLVDGCGLVIVDVRLGKVICTTAEGCCGHKIPAVRFLDATKVFYVSEQKYETGIVTLLVKFDVQSLETRKLTLDKSVMANPRNFVSTTLRADKNELILAWEREHIIIVSMDTWELRHGMLQHDTEESGREQRHRKYNNILAYAVLATNESFTLSFNRILRRTILKLLDSEYSYVTEVIKQGDASISPISPSTLHVCTEYRLAFVGYFHSGIVDIWNLHPEARCIIYTLHAHPVDVSNIHFAPNTHLLYTSSRNQTVKVWDTRQFLTSFYQQHRHGKDGSDENTKRPEESKPDSNGKSLIYTHDGLQLPKGNTTDKQSAIDLTHTTTVMEVLLELKEIKKVTTGVTDLVLTRGGRHVYTCYCDGVPFSWDITSGKHLNQVISPNKFGKSKTKLFNYCLEFIITIFY